MGSVRKSPINKDCLDLIQNVKLEAILELMWNNKMAIVLKTIEIYCQDMNYVYFLQTVIDEDMGNIFMFLKSNLYMGGGGDNKYCF